MEEGNRYDRVWKEQGIYIDIFPLYKQPLWIHMLSEKMQGHVYKIMNRMDESLREMWKVRLITRLNEKLFFPILRAVCRLTRARETYGLGIPYHDPRHMEDTLPLTETEFEGHRFPVPKDCHAALTLKYGDYMQMPDVSQLHPHVGKLEIDD